MLDEFPDQVLICDFHLSDAIECDFSWERNDLYGVQFIPHVFFDGVHNHLGGAGELRRGGRHLPQHHQQPARGDEWSLTGRDRGRLPC